MTGRRLREHLSEERGHRLRDAVSRLNLQLSQAEDDHRDLSELCHEVGEVMAGGPERARVTAALELVHLRELRDRAAGKVDKLRREREEAKIRLDCYVALRSLL